MNLSPDEQDLMTRVVLGEASDDPTERAGVAWNVLNRVGQPGYGDTIRDVILQKGQYESLTKHNGPFYRFSPDAYAKARDVVNSVASGETPDPTNGAMNFLAASMPSNQRPRWAQGDGQQIGKTVFYGGKPQMTTDEADEYLKQHRQESTSDTPSATAPQMTTDEADAYLKQHRAQPTGSAAIAPITADAAAQPVDKQQNYPLGVGASTLFHDLPEGLQSIIREHPYMSGAAAAALVPLIIAALPEEALGVTALWAGRTLINPAIKAAAGVGGVGTLADLLMGGKLHETLPPKLIELISRLGEGDH